MTLSAEKLKARAVRIFLNNQKKIRAAEDRAIRALDRKQKAARKARQKADDKYVREQMKKRRK